MPNPLSVGCVLIEVGTRLPHAVRLECNAFSSTWETLMRPDRRTFEKELAAVGWNLFYLAGRTMATVFGFNQEKALHKAVERVLARIRLQGFNCAEITAVATKSFWRVPYLTVSAHARHIQPGMVLSSLEPNAEQRGPSALVAVATGE